MAVDYDLVIIGDTHHALTLASKATKLKARVAWVMQPENYILTQTPRIAAKLLNLGKVVPRESLNFANLIGQIIEQEINPYEQIENLQAMGVDVVVGTGEFDRRTFITNKRQLTSRNFVIANDPPSPTRKIIGLAEIDYLTCDRLLQLPQLPPSLVIIGNDALSCLVAQALHHLGVAITMLVDSTHILPNADVEVVRILQAQMEIEGIEIYTASRVTAIQKEASGKLKIWTGVQIFECEQILIPTSHSPLPTPHSPHLRIHSCQTTTDIPIILQNTLFLPIAKASNQPSPQAITTNPEAAMIGMTEITARLQYGKDLYVLRQSFSELGLGIGLCKMLVRGNGKIVGAHIVGKGAKELIATIAIAMHSHLKIPQIAQHADLFADQQSGMIAQVALQLAEQQFRRDSRKQSWLEQWFTWRRDWNF